MNTLYYGDNLKILREYIKDESVDLIYLDPPFNSNRNYNVLFKDESGAEADSQITAFEDTWHWNQTAEQTYHELIMHGDAVARMIESFRSFIGNNQMMAYLVMMAVRLKELHRVLKPTGSIYLHCDPTASHYLKVLLDTVFGAQNFRNEITWKRTSAHSDAARFGSNTDIIFFYSASNSFTFNPVYQEYDEAYKRRFRNTDHTGKHWADFDLSAKGLSGGGYEYEYKGVKSLWRCPPETMRQLDEEGRLHFTKAGGIRIKRYLEDMPGIPCQALWDDIFPINSQAAEKLGYPTQKPVALLERIISASSKEGDLVLDPFCGCGTTIAAAQKLNRQWIGIDITHLSVGLQKLRLKDSFNLTAGRDYAVVGQPEDIDGARELANNDRYGFQWWILPLIGAKAYGAEAGKKEGKKGSDKGIDGSIVFVDDNSNKAKRVIVSVKSGHPNVSHIRDLGHVIERENASIGVYITLEPPTKPMLTEAVEKGFYHSPGWNKDYPRLQILTVEGILAGKQVDMPPTGITFKQAERQDSSRSDQGELSF